MTPVGVVVTTRGRERVKRKQIRHFIDQAEETTSKLVKTIDQANYLCKRKLDLGKVIVLFDRHALYVQCFFFNPTELSQSFYTSYWLLFEDFHL